MARVDAEDGYGWEKLFSERMCRHFREDFGLYTRVARFHNVYGPYGTWDGGREKAPAAMCRKVAEAQDGDAIEVWGDGTQIRNWTYIDDIVRGTIAALDTPLGYEIFNLGCSRPVVMRRLVELIEEYTGRQAVIQDQPLPPSDFMVNYADISKARRLLGYEPTVPVEEGMRRFVDWYISRP